MVKLESMDWKEECIRKRSSDFCETEDGASGERNLEMTPSFLLCTTRQVGDITDVGHARIGPGWNSVIDFCSQHGVLGSFIKFRAGLGQSLGCSGTQ